MMESASKPIQHIIPFRTNKRNAQSFKHTMFVLVIIKNHDGPIHFYNHSRNIAYSFEHSTSWVFNVYNNTHSDEVNSIKHVMCIFQSTMVIIKIHQLTSHISSTITWRFFELPTCPETPQQNNKTHSWKPQNNGKQK